MDHRIKIRHKKKFQSDRSRFSLKHSCMFFNPPFQTELMNWCLLNWSQSFSTSPWMLLFGRDDMVGDMLFWDLRSLLYHSSPTNPVVHILVVIFTVSYKWVYFGKNKLAVSNKNALPWREVCKKMMQAPLEMSKAPVWPFISSVEQRNDHKEFFYLPE